MPGEHHRVHVLVAGQRLASRGSSASKIVSPARVSLTDAHVRDDVADFARPELVGLHLAQLEVADLGDLVRRASFAPNVICMPGAIAPSTTRTLGMAPRYWS